MTDKVNDAAGEGAEDPFSATVRIGASAETIFALWSDAPSWPDWDPDLEAASLDGPFADGSRGRLRAKGAPATTIVLSDVRAPSAFTATARLPLCRMVFTHAIEPRAEHCLVTHAVRFEGALGGAFRRLIGPGIRRGLPGTMAGLRAAAEAGTASDRERVLA